MLAVHPHPEGANDSNVTFDRIAGLGAVEVHGAHHRIHLPEVKEREIGDGRAGGKLPARRIDDLELDGRAGLDHQHWLEGVVPAKMALVIMQRVDVRRRQVHRKAP